MIIGDLVLVAISVNRVGGLRDPEAMIAHYLGIGGSLLLLGLLVSWIVAKPNAVRWIVGLIVVLIALAFLANVFHNT